MIQKKNDVAAGIALAFLAAVLWSGNYIVARGLHQKITPVSLAFFRWLTATVVLFPIALRQVKAQWPLLKKHMGYLAVTALLGVTIFNTLIYVAGKYSSAMNLAIIGTSAAPIFVLVLAHWVLKEKAGRQQVIGTLFCVTGILLLISKGSWSRLSQFQLSIGDAWILGAALAFAIYTILVRKKPKEISPLAFLFSIFLLGTLFLLPAFAVDSSNGITFQWSPDIILVFLYLGVGASVGAFLSWNLAIHKIGSARTSLFANLIPVFSTIEAVLILNEENNWVVVVSMAIILFGLLLANYQQIKSMARRSE
jgi:drug/metabolite transporter (DMT)-like permease